MSSVADAIAATRPLAWYRLRDTPANGGTVIDVMQRLDLTLPNPTTITAGTIASPGYEADQACFVWPSSQANSNRFQTGTNSVFDRGSATRDFTMACFADPVADSSVSFPVVMTLGADLNNSVAVYRNEGINRYDWTYRVANAQTGTGSGTGYTASANVPALVALRWQGANGGIMNIDGVDRSTRANPSSKWADGVITARFTPGSRGTNDNWEGKLADAMFWDREVSAAELLSIYDAWQAEYPTGGGGPAAPAAHLVPTAAGWV